MQVGNRRRIQEYTALQQLLEDIAQYMHDMAGLKENHAEGSEEEESRTRKEER